MATTSEGRNRNQLASGVRFLLIGGVMLLLGLVLVLVLDKGLPEGIGAALMALGAIPTLAGIGLCVSGLVEKRSREGKPFA